MYALHARLPDNPVQRQTLEHARRLAESQPDAMLPCPACAARVKGRNLIEHLAKVHPTSQAPSGHEAETMLVLGGSARFLRKPFGVLLALWAVAFAVVAALHPQLGDAELVGFGTSFVAIFGLLCAAIFEMIPARVVLEATQVRVLTVFDFEARRVVLPCPITAGTLLERVPTPGGDSEVSDPGRDVRAGAYVRLAHAGSAVSIGGRGAAGLGEHWSSAGWEKGSAIRSWDVSLDRAGFVALQLHLASLGSLAPRAS